MKIRYQIAYLTLTLISAIEFLNAKTIAEKVPETSIRWWDVASFISVPIGFFLYFALLAADSDRVHIHKFLLSIIMISAGIGLFFIFTMTGEKVFMILSILSGSAYIIIGLWFLYIKDRHSGEAKSLRELPETAMKMGLSYIESPVINRPGKIEGIYKGYRIEVIPGGESGDGRFIVHLRYPLDCELSFYRTLYKPELGMIEFNSGSSLFDSIFKTRYAASDFAEKIQRSGTLLKPVLEFIKKWRLNYQWIFGIWGRSWLKIEKNLIRYSDAPLKGGPYVLPSLLVEKVLPDLIKMAEALENISKL